MGMQLLALPFCLGPFSEFASHTTEVLDTHTLQTLSEKISSGLMFLCPLNEAAHRHQAHV